jgi:hypothetical protein
MKIGLLTLPFNNNYGGLLQSYALQIFLKKNGHDIWLIKRVMNSSIKKTISKIIKIILFKHVNINSHNMQVFENRYMQETEIIKNDKKFNLLDKYKFNVYIVGSDQVWRFNYTLDRKNNYFFDFVKSDDVKRLAFSASFGVDEWGLNTEETIKISHLISKFDAVSVREKEGVKLCREYLNYDATLLLDPTFLLKQEEYKSLLSGNEPDNKDNILVYILDSDEAKNKLVSIISQHLNKKVFLIGKEQKEGFFRDIWYYPTVSSWIKGFDDASFVITDSFHGCVFSIIFKKPFIVIGNKQRGMSRFTSLLNIFNLSDRLIHNIEDIDTSKIKDIDYSNMDSVIDDNLQKTKEFISILDSKMFFNKGVD